MTDTIRKSVLPPQAFTAVALEIESLPALKPKMIATIKAKDYCVREETLDGRMLTIRGIRSDDKEMLQEGMHHLSKESIYARFFTFKSELTDNELKYFTEVDFVNHVALVASLDTPAGERPVGVGRYIIPDKVPKENKAELAFTVDDEYQGLGIGTILMKHLIVIGRANRIERFVAYVMPDNRRMRDVLRRAGLPIKYKQDSAGILEITLTLE
ncbi:MAG: GNAT family N-acetyltransferase [Candidatus Obscuribacterales bacterium]|nr:GNAT family N-acetyltransferase [Candidatus Obscuribacterales bacterium]